jgi:phenylalanyl-tRNA synthetase alpha chain
MKRIDEPNAEDLDQIISRIGALTEKASTEISQAKTLEGLEKLKIQFLGKNGEITAFTRIVGEVPVEQRREVGRAVNQAKERVEELLENSRTALLILDPASGGVGDQIDVTLPGLRRLPGHIHPLTATIERMKEILLGLGFSYDDYPEVESEYFNFDALNTPKWHPARDSHDSFYTHDGKVLRTHTSAFQARAMRKYGKPPIKAITSGRCYRNDDIDASHLPVFHQFDGIAVGPDISFADLKWTLYNLLRLLFGDNTELRFRPSYFPFTTPSAEVDVSCIICERKGCALCSYTGWLEVLGCGMMRPEVFVAGELDPSIYQGFAFGIGVDRITMLRHQIDDIRRLISNEELFLRQF